MSDDGYIIAMIAFHEAVISGHLAEVMKGGP